MPSLIKHHSGPIVPPPAGRPRNDKQLRHDRWTAMAVVAFMIALVTLIVWLASLSGGTGPDGIDYWHMMP